MGTGTEQITTSPPRSGEHGSPSQASAGWGGVGAVGGWSSQHHGHTPHGAGILVIAFMVYTMVMNIIAAISSLDTLRFFYITISSRHHCCQAPVCRILLPDIMFVLLPYTVITISTYHVAGQENIMVVAAHL